MEVRTSDNGKAILGYLGPALVIAGLFLPAISTKGWPNISMNFFDLSAGSSVFIIILAIAIAFFNHEKKYPVMRGTSLGIVAILAVNLVMLYSKQSSLSKEAWGLGRMVAEYISLGWGWGPLFAGVGLSFFASNNSVDKNPVQFVPTETEKIADIDLVLASLKYRDTLDKVQNSLGEPELVQVLDMKDSTGCNLFIYEVSGLRLHVAEGSSWIMNIETFALQYSSARGVKVGDLKHVVMEKYGQPDEVRDYGGCIRLVYAHPERPIENIAFNIDVEANIVTSVSVNVEWD